jgi:hypothetical protein
MHTYMVESLPYLALGYMRTLYIQKYINIYVGLLTLIPPDLWLPRYCFGRMKT